MFHAGGLNKRVPERAVGGFEKIQQILPDLVFGGEDIPHSFDSLFDEHSV
jgi:hypothetical protein